MKKQIIFFILVFCTIFFSGCKKNEEIPLYQDKIYLDTVAFGIPVYYGEFNITTNIGINYQNGLGGALHAGYLVNNSIMCDSNTFLFTLPIVTEPNKIYNVYPQITRNLQISDVPFKVGKFKIIDIAYGDKKNCSVDTFPRASFDIAIFEKTDLLFLGDYKLVKGFNTIEITKLDTMKNEIIGSFRTTFTNLNVKKSSDTPDTVSINCTSFKIPWGRKK